MSLIHDALKEMEKPTAEIPVTGSPIIQVAGRRGGSGWLPGVLVGALVAVGGAAAWWFLFRSDDTVTQEARSVTAPIASQTTADTAPAPVATSEPPAASSEVAPASTAIAATTPAAVASSPATPESAPIAAASTPAQSASADTRPSSVVITMGPEPAAAPAESAAPKKVAHVAKRHAKTAAVAPAPTTPMPVAETKPAISVERLFADFSAALAANDLPRGKALLEQLGNSLPESSLSLLRARAWYAARSNDTPGAIRFYRELLERLPGDENATLNLAALETRAGKPAEAVTLLNEVLMRNPESTQAQKMLRALQEGVR